MDGQEIRDAISALILTYSYRFDWINARADHPVKIKYTAKANGSYTMKVTISRSKYYSGENNSKVKKKAKSLVKKARSYAAAR